MRRVANEISMSPAFIFIQLRHRPGLVTATALGLVAGLIAGRMLSGITAVLVGWSFGVFCYLVATVWVASRCTIDFIRNRAAVLDEGGIAILLVIIGVTVASVVAIVQQLVEAKGSEHAGLSAALAAVTVVLSWTFLHSVFAFHYAHEFYNDDTSGHYRGLEFPGTDTPVYWDFLYFSFITGMTTQVADVVTKSAAMRKLVLAHAVISFFFNTTIIALGVNIAASLVG
jgi:uncharacterized membrane protein